MTKIEIAVFPVGGMGTRFLPATKAVPKEMLPVVDRPLLQYAVDEALEAGIAHFVFVTARGKAAIEDYFDVAAELVQSLKERGKAKELDLLAGTERTPGDIAFIRQQQPAGLGHAVWCARHVVGNRPFAVVLPDDLMQGRPGCLAQMVEAYGRVGGNIIAAERVAPERTASYGIITPGRTDGALTEVLGLVEKPSPADAPSDLAIIGRYILQPEVMAHLAEGRRGAGGEIQLTDAMAEMIGHQPFHGLAFDGVRHDCGDKAGHVIANIAYALERPDIAPAVKAWLDRR
jgi:UTP--glucose-1-phosphate uridylyltransferase